ncbi:MAG: sulfotransferase [Alphaproteobacteria bacterium]
MIGTRSENSAAHEESSQSEDSGQSQACLKLLGDAKSLAQCHDPDALFRLGIALRDQGEFEAALRAFRRAGELPGAPLEATIEAVRIAFSAGQAAEALAWMQRAADRNPHRFEPHFWLGAMHSLQGRHAEATAEFKAALAADPTDTDSRKGLILALVELGQFREAEQPAIDLRNADHSDPFAHALLACIYAETSRPSDAVAAAEEALKLAPNDVVTLTQLARGLALLRHNDRALAVLTRAKRLDPANLTVNLRQAGLFKTCGYVEQARRQLLELVRIYPDQIKVYIELVDIYDFTADDPLIAAMERLLATATKPSEARDLRYALAKAYDDTGNAAAAFHHFDTAKQQDRRASRYDEALTLARMDRMAEIFNADFVKRLAGAGNLSTMPIFIVGMPRSGTTLVEQVLASHSGVSAAGEINELTPAIRSVLSEGLSAGTAPDIRLLTKPQLDRIGAAYLARIGKYAEGRPHVTDKQLTNTQMIGFVHLALPGAKIIHCMRDPIDTCLSSYMKPFECGVEHANDLGTIGRYYRRYHALMAHWRRVLPPGRILDVKYEEVVTDFETQARRIIAHCGLTWEESCLAFHRTHRPVHTISAAQVRKPIYRTSVARWQAYAAFLAPLITALGDLAQTMS